MGGNPNPKGLFAVTVKVVEVSGDKVTLEISQGAKYFDAGDFFSATFNPVVSLSDRRGDKGPGWMAPGILRLSGRV